MSAKAQLSRQDSSTLSSFLNLKCNRHEDEENTHFIPDYHAGNCCWMQQRSHFDRRAFPFDTDECRCQRRNLVATGCHLIYQSVLFGRSASTGCSIRSLIPNRTWNYKKSSS